MTLGLGTLRLAPSSFWSMTPRELTAAVRSLSDLTPHSRSPTRSELDAMMSRFPDSTPRHD